MPKRLTACGLYLFGAGSRGRRLYETWRRRRGRNWPIVNSVDRSPRTLDLKEAKTLLDELSA